MERQRADDARYERRQQVRYILEESGAPKRQRDNATLDRAGEWEETRAKVAERLGNGFLVALVGVRGCGKTQIGVELMRQVAQALKQPRFCSAMDFLMTIKAGYKDGGVSERDVINEFCLPPLLVMDEIGQRSESEWENRLLYELLNRRYNDMKDTLLISNQDVGHLTAALGPSLVSRMRETGGIFECKWESYRR
jgi:DNA replication protein DnaC